MAPPDLRELREELAKLYPHEADARRVASDAGLALARIDFSGNAQVRWQSILDEARKTDELQPLMWVVSKEYPTSTFARGANPLQAPFEGSVPSPQSAAPLPDEDHTLALAYHVAQARSGVVGVRHLLAALYRSRDPEVARVWPSAPEDDRFFRQTLLLDPSEVARLSEVPLDVPPEFVSRRSDRNLRNAIVYATNQAAARGSETPIARDLLVSALACTDETSVRALFDLGILGEPLWTNEHARITVVHTTTPWGLPLAGVTLPTRRGPEPDGVLIDAMASALPAVAGERFVTLLHQRASEAPVSVHAPTSVELDAADVRDVLFSRRAFLATATSPAEAGFAAQAVCLQAAKMGMPSIAIALLDSGRGGLNSVDVARSMFHAIRDAAELNEAPPLVVLTTLTQDVVVALREEAALLQRVVRSSKADPPPARTPTENPIAPARQSPLWLTIRDQKCSWGYAESPPIWERTCETRWADGDLSAKGDAQELAASWSLPDVTAFGDKLAQALFVDHPPQAVLDSLRVERSGPAQRIVFDLDADAARVPWEYLRVGDAFLLDRNVSLVRHVKTVVAKPRPLNLGALPAKMLLAVAAPDDHDRFDALGDMAKIADALQSVGATVYQAAVCTPEKLNKTLADVASDLGGFHFLGHGELDTNDRPVLVVHDERNSKLHADVTGDDLAHWLLRTSARFVFMGACHSGEGGRDEFSGVAQAIVHITGIPVVAMQLAVPQDFSTSFAASFYRLLQNEKGNLEAAVARARAVPHDGRHAFGIPVLFADMKNPPEMVTLPEPPKTWEFKPIVVRFDPRDVAAALAEALPHATQQIIEKVQASPKKLPPAPDPADDAQTTARKVRALANATELTDDERHALLDPLVERNADAASVQLANQLRSIRPIDERSIPRDWTRWQVPLDTLGAEFCLPRSLLSRVVAELLAGRHVLLVGPVGTGKTSLAIKLCEALGYAPLTATASAEWTAADIVGGFWPRTEGDGKTTFAFRPGVFTEAVFANWSPGPEQDGETLWSRHPVGGRWLVLDELNRADMDRAMGGLFTAMETRRLRVPLQGTDSIGTTEVPIPQDFRVIATMNTADRHYLFKLSEALRRRFAFIEVPDALDFANEKRVVDARIERTHANDLAGDEALHDLVWNFVRLARAAYPVGTASVIAARTFLCTSRGSGMNSAERVSWSLLGSVVPILEDAGRDVADLLLEWASARNVGTLAAKLDALRVSRIDEVSNALLAFNANAEGSPAQQIAKALVRPSGSADLDALPELAQRLRAIVRENS